MQVRDLVKRLPTVDPMAKKSWAEMTSAQRAGVVVGGVLELAATAVTLRDLSRRPASQVRGPKLLWVAACAVQPFGPMAYWMYGRNAG